MSDTERNSFEASIPVFSDVLL